MFKSVSLSFWVKILSVKSGSEREDDAVDGVVWGVKTVLFASPEDTFSIEVVCRVDFLVFVMKSVIKSSNIVSSYSSLVSISRSFLMATQLDEDTTLRFVGM